MTEPTDLLRYASDYPQGAVLRDYVDPESGLRMLVVRGPFSFCGYVGVQANHALAGLEELDFRCHHGITLQRWGAVDTPWEPGWYWWGWDYAHFTDFIDFEASLPDDAAPESRRAMAKLQASMGACRSFPSKNWTVGEVAEDALDVLMELKQALVAHQELASLVIKV